MVSNIKACYYKCQAKLKSIIDTTMSYHVDIYHLDYHNRVLLNDSEIILQNYINASYINGPLDEDKNMFIATQGPLHNTIEQFWTLLFNKNIKLVIMLSKLSENGRVFDINLD
jgi:protein tyrosine phosphatase